MGLARKGREERLHVSSLIAAYLFLGGTAAGLFLCAVAAPLVFDLRRTLGNTCMRAFAVSLGMLAVGSLCLLLDLGRPDAIASLFFPDRVSWISLGAWALLALMACEMVLLILGESRRIMVRRALRVLGSLCAVYLAFYTGLLLRMASGVDLWNTAALPVLFFCSSLAAGAAAFILCARTYDLSIYARRQALRFIPGTEAALIAAEIAATIAYLVNVSAQPFGAQATAVLFSGANAVLFWAGFVGLGLAVPLGADILGLRKIGGDWAPIIGSFAALAGAFCLRYVLVRAGINVLY